MRSLRGIGVSTSDGSGPVHALRQLNCDGVFDRFPEIEFFFAETNAAWLPRALVVLLDNYETFRGPHDRKLARLWSGYGLDQCSFGIDADVTETPSA